MAGEFSPTNSVTNTTADVFIPEVWSDEVIASFKENLVLANRVTEFNHQGKKIDLRSLPAGDASDGFTVAPELFKFTISQ